MAGLNVVFVLGYPGAGKGTQCSELAKEFGFPHITVGGLLRDEMNNLENEDHDIISEFMRRGIIVPAEITCKLLSKEIHRITDNFDSKTELFLIDGFPLNLINVAAFDQILSAKLNLKFVMYLQCSKRTCSERIIARSNSGSRYDDKVERIEERLQLYETEAIPVVEHYRSLGKLYEINSERPVSDVYRELRHYFVPNRNIMSPLI